jgi:hypothetical protein
MTRDMRDPGKLGKAYLAVRQPRKRMKISRAVLLPVDPYENGRFISNDPAKHHSRTPQTKGDLTS